jgi:predicted Zn finger-like uncharacterized protein
MSIRVTCDACAAEFQLSDSAAGRKVRCKSCGGAIVVPDAADDLDDTEDDEHDSPARRGSGNRGRATGGARNRRSRSSDDDESLFSRLNTTVGASIVVGLVLVACTIVGFLVLGRGKVDANRPQEFAGAPGGTPNAPGMHSAPGVEGSNVPFAVAQIPLPEFIDARARQSSPSGVTYFEVQTKPTGASAPGCDMKLRLYLPRENAPPKSLGCVLVGPAGSNLISGKFLDRVDQEDETAPYVRAGLAVVHFSLDGPIDNLDNASDAMMAQAYKEFGAAAAGLVNARNAMAFVLTRVPEVDPQRIYIAGHSSAATLALLFAEHEPSLRGCIAYAPACNVDQRLADLGNDLGFQAAMPGIKAFIGRSSPSNHIATLHCPVFLFHGRGDQVVPIEPSNQFANLANGLGKSVKFVEVPDADHYSAMARQGVPLAIQWLKTQFGEPGNGASNSTPNPIVGAVPGVSPVPAPNLTPSGTNLPGPAGTTGVAPKRGDRVVTLRFSMYVGSGPSLTAAQQALKGIPGINPDVLLIDAGNGEITVQYLGGSFNSAALKTALERAGFTIAPGVRMGAWKGQ